MSETVRIQVEIPEDILLMLKKSKQELSDEFRRILALDLFSQGKLSSGKAAELAGMHLSDFMDLTRTHKVPWIRYTSEEIEKEVKEAKSIANKL